jgi:uncharacterized protein
VKPFEFHVGDLRSGRAEARTVSAEVPVEWRVELSRVLPDPPLYFEFQLAPIVGGISVMGTIEATVRHQCRRCLTRWVDTVTYNVTQVITTTKGDDEDDYRLHGDVFDFEDLVRDELMLSLPIAPRCVPECEGLVVGDGNDLNTDPSEDEASATSPFSVLRDLLDNGD